MSLTETFSRFRVGKNVSDRFPIRNGLKQGDVLLPMAYADDVNILAESMHTLRENAESLVAATRKIGLEVSADETKYMVMSRDQNEGRIQSVRIDKSTFERVENFK